MPTESAPQPQCPFVGLQPFTKQHAVYFFGRERDQRIIFNSLYAAPLTVLYGPSGVGKSSILLAGVVPLIESELSPVDKSDTDEDLVDRAPAGKNIRTRARGALVYFNRWVPQQEGAKFCADDLKTQCIDAVRRTYPELPQIDPSQDFDEFLFKLGHAFKRPILIILDQFEEYLLYNPEMATGKLFDDQFAAAVNRENVHVHFLISLREDALSKLDRYRTRIPNLLGNTLRLHPLNSEQAERAIREPLRVYNERFRVSRTPVGIDDRLVTEVLSNARPDRAEFGESAGAARAQGTGNDQIEAAFLQLVMTRLWEQEMDAGSSELRWTTLRELGGVDNIIRTHLDRALEALSDDERKIAAKLFPFLVTPTGTKFAQSPEDLIQSIEHPAEEVTPVLQALVKANVLRRLFPPERYEILHDKLALAVLDWRRRFMIRQAAAEAAKREKELAQRERQEAEQQEKVRQLRRYRIAAIGFGFLFILTCVLGLLARHHRLVAEHERALAEGERVVAEGARRAEQQKAIEAQRYMAIAIATKLLEGANNALEKNNPKLSVRYALQAIRVYREYNLPPAPAQTALQTAYISATSTEYDASGISFLLSVAFCRDGSRLLASGFDEMDVWDTRTHDLLWRKKSEEGSVRRAALSPDGLRVAAFDRRGISIYAVGSNGNPLRFIPATTATYYTVKPCFSSDGKLIAYGDTPAGLRLFDCESGLLRKVLKVESPLPNSDDQFVYFIAMSDDDRYVAALSALDLMPNRSISTQPSGGRPSTLVSTQSSTPADRRASFPRYKFQLTVWEMRSGSRVGTRPVEGFGIPTVAFQPGTDALATMMGRGDIVMLEPKELLPLLQRDHPFHLTQTSGNGESGGPMVTIAFRTDGRRIGAAIEPGDVRVWDVESGKSIESDAAPSPISSAFAFSPDLSSYALRSGSTLRLFRFPPHENIESVVQREFGSNLSAQEYNDALQGVADGLREGVEAARAGKTEEAVAAFERAVKLPGIHFDPRAAALLIKSKAESKAKLDEGRRLAENGDIAAATAAFEEAVRSDGGLEIEPAKEAAKVALRSGLARAVDLMREGKPDAAIKEAKRLAAVVPLENDLPDSAINWNDICWIGSLWGKGSDVLFAGERAVHLAPDHAGYRDSRGVALAEAGEFQRAIADFQAFVDANTSPGIAQRVKWIESLQKHENPFTAEYLKQLRLENGHSDDASLR
jgi:WD40 repeat protein/tetratricopeptide (TPR) repeat protein